MNDTHQIRFGIYSNHSNLTGHMNIKAPLLVTYNSALEGMDTTNTQMNKIYQQYNINNNIFKLWVRNMILVKFYQKIKKINVTWVLLRYKTRFHTPFSTFQNACCPFVWCVLSFDFAIWLGTIRFEFSSEFSILVLLTFYMYFP